MKKTRSIHAMILPAVSRRDLSPEARFGKSGVLPMNYLLARYMCPMEKLYLILSEVVDKTPSLDKTLVLDKTPLLDKSPSAGQEPLC